MISVLFTEGSPGESPGAQAGTSPGSLQPSSPTLSSLGLSFTIHPVVTSQSLPDPEQIHPGPGEWTIWEQGWPVSRELEVTWAQHRAPRGAWEEP